jgi:putative ABC transport system ATP-binding protein
VSETGGDIIVLEKVYREYPAHGDASAVRALRNVSMRVRRGSRIAIKGESGSGKSTLLNLLGGLDVATDGTVVVNDQDLTRLSERDLTRYRATTVGFVFQTFNLLPTLSALENVELPMEAVDTPSAEREARARQLLEAVGMSERAEHRPGQMSGGEQQRVAIARALANNPPLILADEPTGNLDRKSRGAVMRLLAKANEQFGTTLVVVTHDPNAATYCEKIYGIRRGKMVGEVSVTARRSDEVEEPDEEELADDDDEEDEPARGSKDLRSRRR